MIEYCPTLKNCQKSLKLTRGAVQYSKESLIWSLTGKKGTYFHKTKSVYTCYNFFIATNEAITGHTILESLNAGKSESEKKLWPIIVGKN